MTKSSSLPAHLHAELCSIIEGGLPLGCELTEHSTIYSPRFVPQGYNNSKAVTLEASFTPDSQFIMIGKTL